MNAKSVQCVILDLEFQVLEFCDDDDIMTMILSAFQGACTFVLSVDDNKGCCYCYLEEATVRI
jgi:hypothetical protein